MVRPDARERTSAAEVDGRLQAPFPRRLPRRLAHLARLDGDREQAPLDVNNGMLILQRESQAFGDEGRSRSNAGGCAPRISTAKRDKAARSKKNCYRLKGAVQRLRTRLLKMSLTRDVHLHDLVVFGSLSVSLDARPTSIAPRLPFSAPSAIIVDGEPDLMAALRWEYGLTPTLRGRDAALAAILDWAEGGGCTVSVRLLSGSGGAGKTRLAAEAARRLRERGWSAGFLPRDARDGQVIHAEGRAAGGGLMLIIDYPEERLEVVERLFEYVADIVNPPLPIRFLLVSRQGFDDWRRRADVLGGRFGRQELAIAGPLEPADALAALREAAESLAALTGAAVPPLDAAEDWQAADPARRLALSAMAAGLHAVLTGRSDFALGAPELMREVARREHQRVRRVSRACGLGEHGLERLLGLALMTDAGLDAASLERLGALEAAPGINGQALLDAVAQTPWWGRTTAGERRLARLEPHRPAAAFIDLALLDDPSPRLPDWLHAASAERGAGFGRVLSRLVWDLIDVSVEGRGAAALERAAIAMIDAEPDRAAAFGAVGFEKGTAFSAAFAARVLQHLLPNAQTDETRSTILHNLPVFLAALGRHQDALEAAQEAVGLNRRLAAARPDAFTPDLAMALNNLANCLSDLGRRDDALAAAEEATSLFHHLFATVPNAFMPDLAGSLSNLAGRLADLGRYEDALGAAEDSVVLHRRLAAMNPDDFTPGLATSLNNLGNMLSDLGLRQSALAAAKESVELRRHLTEARPDAFMPDLAMALNNLANRFSGLGLHHDALPLAEETVGLYRRLAAARPVAFTPELAGSLNNLANVLSEIGRRANALAAAEEAVGLYRSLIAAWPDAFTPDLAMAFDTLGNMLSDLGRREDALAVAAEAVALRRRLAAAKPDAFTPDLAGSLNNLAVICSDLGRREDARAAAEEAFELLAPFFLSRPSAFVDHMQVIARVYLEVCAALSRDPSAQFVAPVVEALAQLTPAGGVGERSTKT